MTTLWSEERTTIYWAKVGDIHIFVFRLPAGVPIVSQWRWSAWRGEHQLYMSGRSYETREQAQTAALSYGGDRMYCA